MQPTDATPRYTDGTRDGFWDRYVAHIRAKGVQSTAARWYVIRAEHYLQAFVHKRLADHTPQDVTDYLEKLGRIGSIADWQYRQTVEALQHVFVLSEVTWAQQFDWAYWQASARPLSVHHPTIAREAAPAPVRGNAEPQQTGGVSRARVRETPPAWLDALRAEIRRRGYSIRTEQAYESWIARYLAFVGDADPCGVGNAEVKAFLQHLAVERLVTASTQNQALNALVFLYQHIVRQPLGDLDGLVRAKRPQRLPVV